MKKIICSILLVSVLLTSSASFAAPIHRYEEIIPISKSITLTKVREFYANHNISYSYIKADLNDESISLKLLKSDNGADILDTVPNLANTQKDTVAAINADFFSVHSGNKGFSLGIEVKDGEMLQSPINPDTMATISSLGNTLDMNYLSYWVAVVAPNGNYETVRHINKHTAYYGDILMYTADFNGGYSPAPGGEVVEVVVSDGKIVEFRRSMPSVKIPEDGCVLVVSEGVNMFLANNLSVGDEIKFDYYITPDVQKSDIAFGGGAMLVQEGKALSDFSHVVSGYNPRSAIGMSQDGKQMWLVAVDGRQTQSRGMTMTELAGLMKELGCYNAVNLDGGGSTNMVASTIWNKDLTKANSPTENRKVINAIGLGYKETSGIPYGITLKPDKDTVFIGESVSISAALYDENMRPVSGDVALSSDYGEIRGNIFTPQKSGTATIKATGGSAVGTTDIYVVDKVSGIDVPSHIRLKKGESKTFNINVFDEYGHYVPVTNTTPFKITSWNTAVVNAKGSNLVGVNDGTAIVTIEKDGAISYISVAVGENSYSHTESVEMTEPINHIAAPQNVYTDITPASGAVGAVKIGAVVKNPQTLLSGLTNSVISRTVGSSGSNALIGALKPFSSHEDANALYISINTSKGGIRNTDSSQWNNIANAIYKTKKDNIFILSDYSIYGSNEFENSVIRDYFSSLDKNIFVITGGDSNTYKNIDGVKYFTICNTEKEELSATKMDNYRYLEFSFGDSVTFDWKKVF